jgi:cyclophilin family peptidyl-prolyl cis-trans isomerase
MEAEVGPLTGAFAILIYDPFRRGRNSLPGKPRKRRRRGPPQFAGQPKKQWPFPINMIFNVKAFYAVFIVVMIVSMASVGLVSSSSGSNTAKPSPIDITNTPVISAAPVNFASPAPVIDATKAYLAAVKTNAGDIEITLATDTPQTVNSFAFLAAKRFFDGAAFFYIDHDYWAQTGDPDCRSDSKATCTGTRDAGYKLPAEDGALKHVKWSVVAPQVQGGADQVSGGQFRILFATDERLDGKETVFGTVTKGQEILEQHADFLLCTALTQTTPDCVKDLSGALVIESVVVAPK